jgi:myo-inositol-1(or 4)-monophosphatase
LQAADRRPDAAEDDLALLLQAAREAGTIAMRFFQNKPEVWMKTGNSPVSEADIAADRHLKQVLLAARPTYGWLSEETADTPDRLALSRTFVVDPIDGTRAFIEGRTTWCVSVAIVENGRTVAGVLDCPARHEIFSALPGRGAWLNGERIAMREAVGMPEVAGPRSLLKNASPAMLARFKPVPYIPSLAYRLAMIAAGRLDATLVGANSHDWDLAAADLILAEAGGTILDRAGERPRYASADPRHDLLVAGSGALVADLRRLIAARR